MRSLHTRWFLGGFSLIWALWCCSFAYAEPFAVASRAMKWEPRFEQIGAFASRWRDGSIRMPYVSSGDPAVARRINQRLFFEIMGMPAPLTLGTDFSLGVGVDPPASTTSQDFSVERNDGRILVFKFDWDTCTAYCESRTTFPAFDAQTGRFLTLDDLLTDAGRRAIPKLMLREQRRRYREAIQSLKLERRKAGGVSSGADPDLQDRLTLHQTCLKEISESTLQYFEYDLSGGKTLVFIAERCSNYAMRALDDVQKVELTFSGAELAKMLTPYGAALLLDAPSVSEPSSLSGQVLQGKIGSAAVTALFTVTAYGKDQVVEGFYYYDKYRKPITLSGKRVGQAISLQERDGEKERANITLKIEASGWRGHWDGGGKIFPMALSIAK